MVKMNKAYKFRLYPNKEQIVLINKHFGCSRKIYNHYLSKCIVIKEHWKGKKKVRTKKLIGKFNYSEFQSDIVNLKKETFTYLKEINSQSLQVALQNLKISFKNFFEKRSELPNFKSKYKNQSFNVPQSIKVIDNRLFIPKFKNGIKIKLHRKIEGKIKQCTISKVVDKYYVSILVEIKKDKSTKKLNLNNSIGIDLGLKHFAILSNGEKIANPKHLKKSENKLKKLQRKLKNKKLKSNNYNKQQKLIARLHHKIKNQRDDFLHKTSCAITKRFDYIFIEDLAVNNMVKNKKLSKSISDVGWGRFASFLNYKSNWNSKHLSKIERFFPSSKIHNKCGYKNKNLKLSDRYWLCSNCNERIDRDINAAKNIKDFGILKIRQELSELKLVETALLGNKVLKPYFRHQSMKQEAPTFR